jgi:uncharacterized protein
LDGGASAVLDSVRRLGFLQLDPTRRVERTEYLVLWSRLGPYDRGELERLLWETRDLVEWNAFVYPVEDLPLLRAQMRRWKRGETPQARRADEWLRRNEHFRRYVLRELRRRGPLLSRELEDRADRTLWESSVWWGRRSVAMLLEVLNLRGEIAVVDRRSGQRLWDLAERWYPPGRALPWPAAERALAERTLRTLGIARRGPGAPARVEGVERPWVVDPAALERADEPVPERTTLLSPFDRLIRDRERTEALFGFRYRLEIYVPKEKREYGFFVLPVLRGDRLIGRIDPEYDRATKALRIHAVYAEPGEQLVGLDEALAELARFLGAASVEGLRG